MWRAAGQPLLSLVVVVGATGCGSSASEPVAPAVEASRPATGSAETVQDQEAPVEQTAPPAGQGTLADVPAFQEDFSRPSEQWPDPAQITDGVYLLPAGQSAPIPYRVPESALGALVEVGVVMAEGGGTALTCDLGPSGAIVLDLRADGGYSVTQDLAGSSRELTAGDLPPGQRGEPGELTALRLLCADGPDGLAVAVSLHGAGLSFVSGATGEVPTDGPTWTVTSTGSVPARIDTVRLSLVEA